MSDRARYWAGLVASWQKSGVSQTEFCRRRGVNAITFSCWKGRLLGQGKSVGRGMAPGASAASATVRSTLRSTRTGRRAGSFVDPFAYLKDVLTRISTHPADRVDQLLPRNWKNRSGTPAVPGTPAAA
jgi:hypothetical protein